MNREYDYSKNFESSDISVLLVDLYLIIGPNAKDGLCENATGPKQANIKGFWYCFRSRPILNALREFLGSGSWVVVRH